MSPEDVQVSPEDVQVSPEDVQVPSCSSCSAVWWVDVNQRGWSDYVPRGTVQVGLKW